MSPPPSKKKPPRAELSSPRDILKILVSRKVLTAEDAERARRSARLNAVPHNHAIIQLGLATEAQIAEALAAHAGLRFISINPLDLDLDVVTTALPGPFARKHGLVAVAKAANTLTVAVHDPFAPFPLDDIRQVTGLDVEQVVATQSDVETVNKGFYDLKTSLTTAEEQLSASRLASVELGNQEFLSAAAEELDPAAAPVVKALDHILAYAFDQRASDIHFEPKRDLTLVRLRIDGILHDIHLIPKIVYQAVISRIKLLSGCNLAEKRRPQDGRIKREQGSREVELRVSTMPTAFGEKAVLRIFDPEILLTGVDELGLSAHDLPKFYDFIGRSTGIILVTGPTGSGKTTTLYSILKYLSKPEVNILTIEDPIEIFATALRTVLRQDPDIIMVGEIRDGETADHAVQAALTGHLVLSTLHTNDASASVTRLRDLGVPHFLITSTLIGILAQRLVRVNCPQCSEEYTPTAEEAKVLGIPLEKLGAQRFKRGRGCLNCRQTGYVGRDGIFEVLPMTERVRELITKGAGSTELRNSARREGMRTLREAAIEKVSRGITTVTEMVRVTGK